jgi:hypothetical protein
MRAIAAAPLPPPLPPPPPVPPPVANCSPTAVAVAAVVDEEDEEERLCRGAVVRWRRWSCAGEGEGDTWRAWEQLGGNSSFVLLTSGSAWTPVCVYSSLGSAIKILAVIVAPRKLGENVIFILIYSLTLMGQSL